MTPSATALINKATKPKAAPKPKRKATVGVLTDLLGNDNETPIEGVLKLVSLDNIEVRPQARKVFKAGDMEDLKASIEEGRNNGTGIEGTGIDSPLQVYRNQPGAERDFVLNAGGRRYRAAGELGLKAVPVIVISEQEATLAQIRENTARADLTPWEESEALHKVREEQGLTIRGLAAKVGKGPGWVQRRLDMQKFGEDVKELCRQRADVLDIAATIDAVEIQEVREELIEMALNGESSRTIEAAIDQKIEALEKQLAPERDGEAEAANGQKSASSKKPRRKAKSLIQVFGIDKEKEKAIKDGQLALTEFQDAAANFDKNIGKGTATYTFWQISEVLRKAEDALDTLTAEDGEDEELAFAYASAFRSAEALVNKFTAKRTDLEADEAERES